MAGSNNSHNHDHNVTTIIATKGMESGMAECFGPIAEKAGKDWAEFAKAMKKADRYHVEVY